ncbi:MAG: CsgG/HfaB family protein [Paludibacter sp.]|nr:CsgG/HfaB family protein [Paludibacter sp.]
MKSFIFSIIFFTIAISIFSQETDEPLKVTKLRVAVMDPSITGNVFDEGTGTIVRELVSTAMVETGKYSIIERSLIDKILKEQKFSNSGVVDEGQAVELGKLAGANKVVISVLSSYGNRGMLSLKMIDVASASIESQKSKLVSPNDILDVITPLTYETIGEEASVAASDNENKNLLSKSWSKLTGKSSGKDKKESSGKDKKESSGKPANTKTEDIDAKQDSQQQFEKVEYGTNSGISLVFAGEANSKNPEARIYLDEELLGEGTLNEGFSINFEDSQPGAHQLRIEWSGVVPSKTYKINTKNKRKYIFGYKKTGFGYEFSITN